jgi:hypothetical protein
MIFSLKFLCKYNHNNFKNFQFWILLKYLFGQPRSNYSVELLTKLGFGKQERGFETLSFAQGGI